MYLQIEENVSLDKIKFINNSLLINLSAFIVSLITSFRLGFNFISKIN